MKAPGVSGLVLTQLTDVENERNGAIHYDRTAKDNVPVEQTGMQMRAQLKAGYGPSVPSRPGINSESGSGTRVQP